MAQRAAAHKREAAPEESLLSSESESEEEEEDDDGASRFFRFFEPGCAASPAAPRASGSSSLGSMKRGRTLGLSSCCVRVGRAV
jgi:hypothetical protein